jgi:hypothetical protein
MFQKYPFSKLTTYSHVVIDSIVIPSTCIEYPTRVIILCNNKTLACWCVSLVGFDS